MSVMHTGLNELNSDHKDRVSFFLQRGYEKVDQNCQRKDGCQVAKVSDVFLPFSATRKELIHQHVVTLE